MNEQQQVRIPINSDTCSNPFRTVFRDIRTVVGAKRRSASMFKGVSELSQSFPLAEGPFRSLKGDEFWRSAIAQKRAVRAIPKWGSAATGRSVASRRLAACSVAQGPHLGVARTAVENSEHT
jgi:hypothetical protein